MNAVKKSHGTILIKELGIKWRSYFWIETLNTLTISSVMTMRAVVVTSMSSPPSVFCFKFRIRWDNVCSSTAKSALQQDWGWLAVWVMVVTPLPNHSWVWIFCGWDDWPWWLTWKSTYHGSKAKQVYNTLRDVKESLIEAIDSTLVECQSHCSGKRYGPISCRDYCHLFHMTKQ